MGAEKPTDGHGAVIRTPVSFGDVTIEFSFRILDGRGFNLVINDQACKTVHAGHICRVAVSSRNLRIGDDKEGVMRKDIFEMRRDPKRKEAAEKLLVGRSRNLPVSLEKGIWYKMRVSIIGPRMHVSLNGKSLGQLTSPGISHPTKTDFGFTVRGKQIEFDDVKAWKMATPTNQSALP